MILSRLLSVFKNTDFEKGYCKGFEAGFQKALEFIPSFQEKFIKTERDKAIQQTLENLNAYKSKN